MKSYSFKRKSILLILTVFISSMFLLMGCKNERANNDNDSTSTDVEGEAPDDIDLLENLDLGNQDDNSKKEDNTQETATKDEDTLNDNIIYDNIIYDNAKYMNKTDITMVKDLTTASPNNEYNIYIWSDSQNSYYYSVLKGNDVVIAPSSIGIRLKEADLTKELNLESGSLKFNEIDESYETITLSANTARNHCNETSFTLSNSEGSFDFILRAYDDGIAFRYMNVTAKSGDTVTVEKEQSEFVLVKDTTTWALSLNGTYEGDYVERSYFSFVNANGKFTTPLLAINEKYCMLFSEAAVFNNNGDYSKSSLQTFAGSPALKLGFGLARNPNDEAKDDLDSPGHKEFFSVTTRNGFNTPWRAAIITDNINDLATSTLISNLNPTPDPNLFPNTDYIKPGKVAWSWWSESGSPGNYNRQIEYIDFASENGWDYVCLDAGWRSYESRLKEICDYAKEKSVGIFVWVNYRELKDYDNMDQLFSKWKSAGVVGVKTDYFESDEISVLNVIDETAKCAARYELMVLYHGCISPCGEYRTYPNIMTMEAVMGEEFRKWSTSPTAKNCLVYPFTRNVVGSMDYTPVGYKLANVDETFGFSLAKTVIYESSLQHFAHSEAIYKYYIGLPFLNNIPTTWDRTIVLEGYPGQYATYARNKDDDWFLASMTLNARKVDFPLDFLGDGQYNAYIYKDNEDGSSLLLEERLVRNTDRLTMDLLNVGGFAVMITKSTIDTSYEIGINTDIPGYVYYEAESEDNILSGASVIANSVTCSGTKKVGYVGNGPENTLEFNIEVKKEGTYRAILYYCSGENRKTYVSVNGGPEFELSGLNSGSYDNPEKIEFDVSLKVGVNVIKFSEPTYYAPDFDRLAISEEAN
ncbi:MAG: hypothetical protein GX321_06990 [Clostridiales bacterium]|nr:hypothetical protein [Clostridiales bacterium]